MNQFRISKLAVGVALAGATLLVGTTAMAALPNQQMHSIADSWHNLGSAQPNSQTPSGNATQNHSSQTAEICVFCHTPHGGDNSAAVPIWNRKLNSPTAYKRYSDLGSSTFDATEAPVGSVTIACLSCHDGGQAIDSLINEPGSGGYNDPSQYAYGSMPRLGGAGASFTGGDADAATGRLSTTVVQNLGAPFGGGQPDLSNDHPVSMQYAGGGFTGAAGQLQGSPNDPDFTGGPTNNPQGVTLMAKAAPKTAPFDTLFWIERGADSLNNGDRDREDVILYTRTDLGKVEPFVECGSCHDPHNVSNPTFLRTSNGIPKGTTANPSPESSIFPGALGDNPSGLCLTCHVK